MSGEHKSLATTVLRDPVHWLAFGFGSGLSPVAPGTAGSLLALPLAWLTLELGLYWQLSISAALFVSGIWICGESARRIGVHDHGGIVWDEIAAMYLVLAVAPPTVTAWALSFLAFRLFDIVKPWPIRDLDHRMRGGLGIMLDDLAAALYAIGFVAFYGWFMN